MEKTKMTIEKPNWLLNLEQESWQAELIISGLAILGSLQLPDLIDRFGQWGLTYFSADLGFFLTLFLIYLHFTSGILIFAFISHFILRAIWIGFIGLNSVFPEGIKSEGGMYSKIFMEKFKADYDHENYGIKALDNFCSSVFGVCTLVILFSLGFCTGVLIAYGLYTFFNAFLPPKILTILTYGLLILLMIPSVTIIILKRKKYEQNERLQSRFYKFFNVFNFLVLHVFRGPALYISFLLSTNIKVKQYVFALFGLILLLYGFGFYRLIDSGNILLVNQDAFHEYYSRTDRTNAENYEEYLTAESAPIYSAIIPTKLIEGSMMNVFIPIFPNEEEIYANFCGVYLAQESTSSIEKKRLKREYYSDCYQKYHRIYINDQLYDFELVKFTHPHRSSEGVLTYIPTVDFKKGKNILKVEKLRKGKANENEIYRTMVIPFWFSEH